MIPKGNPRNPQMLLPIFKEHLPGATIQIKINDCFEFWTSTSFCVNSLKHYHPDENIHQTLCVDVYLHPWLGYVLKLLHPSYGIMYLPIKHHFKHNSEYIYINGIRYKNWIRKFSKQHATTLEQQTSSHGIVY